MKEGRGNLIYMDILVPAYFFNYYLLSPGSVQHNCSYVIASNYELQPSVWKTYNLITDESSENKWKK